MAGILVDVSALNVTESGAIPSLGVTLVKLATGIGGGGIAVTLTTPEIGDTLLPPVFIAVNFTVYVPGNS